MKQLVLSLVLLARLAAAAVEVVVYSPPSDKPLHVSGGGVTRTFPASYTGHRAVCAMPGASTNDTFVAWTGDETYAPGDPYGVSSLMDYPTVELTEFSPVTPRIDVFSSASDRARTVADVYEGIRRRVFDEFGTSPEELDTELRKLFWMTNNVIAAPDLPGSGDVRVRVVRWLVDGKTLPYLGVTPRVILDRTFNAKTKRTLTEADFLTDGAFDLDWANLRSEVVMNRGVTGEGLYVEEVDYLIVIGDGIAAWRDSYDTNRVVRALDRVITRRYGTNRVQAVALPSGEQPLTHPVFRFRADCPELEGYTACELQVMSGSVTNWTTGTVRMPPRDATGAYIYSAPDLTGMVQPGDYTWRVLPFNSKYSNILERAWSEPESVTLSEALTNTAPRVAPIRRTAEVVVYSPPSDKPLHVSGGGVTRTFPASYTGHRAVCAMPGASTNDTFVAWTGDEAYAPGDPYGVSSLMDYPTVELTEFSPVTPRIDVFSSASDRARTVTDVYEGIRRRVFDEFGTSPGALDTELRKLFWMTNNVIAVPDLPGSGDVRVRVVRWLVDGKTLPYLGVTPRVVLDRTFNAKTKRTLTEADFLTDGAFDLDWASLHSEVVMNTNVRREGLGVNEVDYLIVIGDGIAAWRDSYDTNRVVRALDRVITRRYGMNRVQAVALPSGEQPLTHPVFRFRADCPELEGCTACELQVMSGSVTNWTTGTVRMPPRDATGAYIYSAPDLTGMVSPETEHTWRVILFNSKYSNVSTNGWSALVPVIFDAQE